MVFIETPASRAAWKTTNRGGGNHVRKHPHAAHPITFDDSRTNPIRQKATQPPVSTLRIGRGPRFRRGPRAPRNSRATRRRHPAFLCGIPGRVRYPGRFQDSALKCGMRPRIYRSPTRCFGACGTAARRLPGDTSRRYPHLRQFQGGTEKVGSGPRDLVNPRLPPFRISSI
jgi:hypothetical protein